MRNMVASVFANTSTLLKRVSSEAFDLIRRMVLQQPSTEDCLDHPFFWSPKQRFAYVSELVRNGKHLQLPRGETLGLGTSDWRNRIPRAGLLTAHMLENRAASYHKSPKDLLRLMRNFYQHPPLQVADDPLVVAAKELKCFDVLFISLHSIFGL